MGYLYLAIAIITEVAATSALKASQEFTKLIPSLIVVIGYGVAFYLLTLVLRTIPVGIAYALWAGVGIVLVAIIGAILYKQIPDFPAAIGIGLIVAGIEYAPTVDIDANIPPQILEENVVTIIEKWESLEALTAHLSAPHMLSYREKIKGIVEDVSIKVLQEA